MGTWSWSPFDKWELFDTKTITKEISINDFEMDWVIGKGGFGKVK